MTHPPPGRWQPSRARWSGIAVCLSAGLLAGCEVDPRVAGPAGARPVSPSFTDATEESGLTFAHVGASEKRFTFPEIVGSGAAWIDHDGDGDLDLYLVQSGDIQTGAGLIGANRLFVNDNGVFRDVTEETRAGDLGYGMGCAVGDYDADGDPDLYVTNLGRDTLYRNDDGIFTDVTDAAGTGDAGWGTSAAFLDYDQDGDLDLFVVNYVVWSSASEPRCTGTGGQREYCGPNSLAAPARDSLYRNDGDGTFTDVSIDAGLDTANGNGLGIACADMNNDGWIDIYVANDGLPNQLWINQGDGTFRDEALLNGCAVSGEGVAEAGMGVAVADFDEDGFLDLFMTHLTGETNTLYMGGASGAFRDRTVASGLAAGSRMATGFGVGVADFDLDGHLDIFVANGAVKRPERPLDAEHPYAEPEHLFRGLGNGEFEDVSIASGVSALPSGVSRGAAFADYDNDGDIDVVVIDNAGPARLLRNTAPRAGAWIGFRVEDANGAEVPGAVVELTTSAGAQSRVVGRAYSYCSSNDPRVHFGLPPGASIETLRVRWPGAITETFEARKPNAVHVLRRGTGQ